MGNLHDGSKGARAVKVDLTVVKLVAVGVAIVHDDRGDDSIETPSPSKVNAEFQLISKAIEVPPPGQMAGRKALK